MGGGVKMAGLATCQGGRADDRIKQTLGTLNVVEKVCDFKPLE